MILDLLTPKTIKTKVSAGDWKEAGRVVGQMLVDVDGAEPGYTDAMIKAVEDMGPYIVLAQGVALFHARPEDGAKSICLSLATLDEGVSFGAGDKDPVKLALALGATDNQSHLNLLRELVTIIGDSDLVEKIVEASSGEEVLDLITKKLNSEG